MPAYCETRVTLPRNCSPQVDATPRPGPLRTGLRRWGGRSGDPAQNSRGHSYSGFALEPSKLPSRVLSTAGPIALRFAGTISLFLPLSLLVRFPSLAHRIAESNPQVQQAQAGDKAAHGAVGGNAPQRWMLGKEWILIPDHWQPGENADKYANPNPEHHADKQLGALEPAGNPLMCVRRNDGVCGACLGCSDRNRPRNWGRRAHRTHRQQWRCGFRQLRHALSSHRIPVDPDCFQCGCKARSSRPDAGTP